MAEYIEREKLLNAMEEMCNRVCDYSPAQRHFMCGCCPLGSAIELVEEFPVADVQPVTRGHFGKHTSPFTALCSECGTSMNMHWNYCPNCGADMREES